MKEIMRSKIIWFMVLIIVIMAAASGAVVQSVIDKWGMSKDSTDMIGVLNGKADVVMGGKSTEDIRIVNGEKGYFLIEEKGDDCYYMVNLNGEKLLDGKSFERTELKCDNLIPLYNGTTWQIMNTEMLEVVGSADWYNLLEIHESKEYMLGYSKDNVGKDHYEVRTIAGKLIYSSNEVMVLPQEQGYAIVGDSFKNRVINLETGKTVYQANEWESVIDGGNGFWVIEHREPLDDELEFQCRYALDANFESALNGQLFRELYISEGWLAGHAYFYDGISNELALAERQSPSSSQTIVYDGNGEVLVQWNSLGIRGTFDDTLILEDSITMEKCVYRYYEMNPYNPYNYGKSEDGICYMDFEDGYALTSIPLHGQGASYIEKNPPVYGEGSTENDRWTYMDENYEPISEYAFLQASLSENGYAAVRTESGVYLIDLYCRISQEVQ